MSFRFQKRVKIAPGVRLNFSKRGISTSVGRRGASLTLGKRGLYGNVGIPGSGMSYRTRLDTKITNAIKKGQHVGVTSTDDIQLAYDKRSNAVTFVNEKGEALPVTIESEIKREFKNEIEQLYRDKESEINADTERLLDLHHQLFPLYSKDELKQMIEEKTKLELTKPNKQDFYKEVEISKKEAMSTLSQLTLLLPSKRQSFLKEVEEEASSLYKLAAEEYMDEKKALAEEKQTRLDLLRRIALGETEAIADWVELHLSELDFPLETNVSFDILSTDTIYFDVDLPQMEEIPLSKATIMKSGKLKVGNKTQRETREHYALMIGGTAFYIASFAFAFIPSCKNVIISGYSQYLNEATGHLDDKYLYSLVIDEDTFYSLNFDAIHPIAAFANFKHRLDTTKTFIFKEVEPFQPDEFR